MAKVAIVYLRGCKLSTQAKKCEMRPRPVSEEKEVEGLDQGEKGTCC